MPFLISRLELGWNFGYSMKQSGGLSRDIPLRSSIVTRI